MKILKRVLVLGLLLLVALAVAGWLFFDPLVKKAIEKGSTFATGVETNVGSVSASPTAGKFGLENLTLANPPGFRQEPFVRLGSARAAWQNGTLLSDAIEMDELVVENVDVNLERTGDGTNYGKILDHLGQVSGGGKEPEKKAPAAKGKSLRIKKIEIRNVHAAVHLSGLPIANGSTEVKIPSLVIDDFRSDGDTTEIVAKLTHVLVQSILEGVLASGKDILPAELLKDLGGNLKGFETGFHSDPEGTLKGVHDAIKGAGDLFKKKK